MTSTPAAQDPADVAVVGLGLIGAAALRHLADLLPWDGVQHRVVGIGPAEPSRPAVHKGPFASHYDSGRITRRVDAHPVWSELAHRSIVNYPLIEQASQLEFHHQPGLILADDNAAQIEELEQVVADLDVPGEASDGEHINRRFPEIHLPPKMFAFHEPGPAGFIDPRVMNSAQLIAAEGDGARIIRAAAESVSRTGDLFTIEVAGRDPILAHQVLVASGAYTNGLIPRPLDLNVIPEAVLLAEVDHDTRVRLENMPSIIAPSMTHGVDFVYIVPPTAYPDGRWCVKIGAEIADVTPFDHADQMHEWMSGQAADAQLEPLRDNLRRLVPDMVIDSWQVKPCLITRTPTRLPYIDHLEDGLVVAVGGNGRAGKSADAIGSLAAQLSVAKRWTDTELSHSHFEARFAE